MINKLFVYGTLGPGRPNEHILKAINGEWSSGAVKGILHEKGWGATLGYPAIELDENGEWVNGFLFSSDQLETYWKTVDDFEGEGYERVLTQVKLEDGTATQAYIYILKK